MPLLTLLSGFSPLGNFTEIWEPNFTEVGYHPTTGAENAYQFFNVYLPDPVEFPVPANGYPCVVRINLDDGYTGSTKPAEISSDLEAWSIVEGGMALCDATITFTTTGGSVTNGGLFSDPSDAGWSGASDIPEQDVVYVIQKLRDDSISLGIDGSKIALFGPNNAAASVCLWVAMSADFADSGAATTQEQQSSVPTSCFAIDPTAWYPGCQTSLAQNHLRDSSVTTNPAATLGNATSDHLDQASPIWRADQNSAPSVPAVLLMTDTSPSSATTETDTSDGLPRLENSVNAIDDGWHSQVWKEWMRRYSKRSVTHAQWSEVWVRPTAQRAIGDRVVTPTGDALAPYVVSYFRAALGAYYNANAWSIPFLWNFQVNTTREGVRTGFESVHGRQTRHGVSRARLTASTRRWQIGFPGIHDTDADTLRALEAAVEGKRHEFDFDAPDAPGIVSVQMVSDSLQLQHVDHNQWAYSVELEEAI